MNWILKKNRKGEKVKFNNFTKMVVHKLNPKRFIEIDMLRGLAIILMVFGHILWDLNYFGLAPMNNNIYSLLQQTVPPLFFLIVGISLVVSKKKIENRSIKEENEFYKHLFIRGLKIFCLGIILTIFSLIIIPNKPVVFGVLHCIGLSVILSIPFLKYSTYNLLFAAVLLFAGSLMGQYSVENPSIFHLAAGFHQTNVWIYTIDYFPLLPWFGVVLIGIYSGNRFYENHKRTD